MTVHWQYPDGWPGFTKCGHSYHTQETVGDDITTIGRGYLKPLKVTTDKVKVTCKSCLREPKKRN